MFCLNRVIIVSLMSFSLSLLLHVRHSCSAMDPRFELDSQALGISAPPSKTSAAKTSNRSPRSRTVRPALKGAPGAGIHTVKSGDNLFKILMRDYGLNNDEAESFIEEIRRENNIYDIKRLKIGQKIIIPPIRRKADGSLNILQAQKGSGDPPPGVGQAFRLESPVEPLTEQESAKRMRLAWDTIVPPVKGDLHPIAIQTPTFSLTLDPARYPVYTAMNNGRILIDQNASIPPLVKSLITEKDPSVRIVSESPSNGERFIAALLESAGFYSVEDNFTMNFGSDPKLTIHSDFKVEKTPDSLIKHDVLLINSGRVSLPSALGEFLKKEGFSVIEPFGSSRQIRGESQKQIVQIASKNQSDIIDAILSALSVTSDKDRKLDVFAADNNGISLSVKADRYFEHSGRRSVVTHFDGDPVAYTLFRVLEAKGYQVVILDAQDDFRKIADKLLTGMRLTSSFSQQKMSSDDITSYSVLMSGIKLEGSGVPQGGIFLTNLELDPIIRTLLKENGYSITTK